MSCSFPFNFVETLLLFSAAVENLGAGAEFAHSHGSDPYLIVPGDFPTGGQDLFKTILRGLGEGEVTDARVGL